MSRKKRKNNHSSFNGDNNVSQYRDYSRYSRNASSSNYSSRGSSNYRSQQYNKENPGNGSRYRNANAGYNQDMDVSAAQFSRTGTNHYSHKKNVAKRRNNRRKNIFVCLIILLVLGIGGIAVYKMYPIKVNINNKECQLTYSKTIADAVESTNTIVKPGNYVAVDLSTITAGEGYEYYCEVNGQEITDIKYELKDGDNITFTNGKDRMEEYTSVDSNIKATAKIDGTGSIHKFNGDGSNGTWSKMTGKVSKKYAERQTKEPGNVVCHEYNVNPGTDKVIALTFDDGPNDEYTQQILDLLKKYNAHATFCVIGENCEEDWAKKLLRAEDNAGHQICTHSYDHARAAGGTDITGMTAEKQIQEITKGLNAIEKAIGHEPSSVVRLPGGNICEATIRLIAPYVSAEIGWNVDTGDWEMPGKDKIVSAAKEASSGDIILCHDGGGDRSQTVRALEEILPYFTDKGYKFVTVDELMEYPEATQKTYR